MIRDAPAGSAGAVWWGGCVRHDGYALRHGPPCAARGLCGGGPLGTAEGGRERRFLLRAAKGRFESKTSDATARQVHCLFSLYSLPDVWMAGSNVERGFHGFSNLAGVCSSFNSSFADPGANGSASA